MNVFELFAKITLDSSEYEKGVENAKKSGNGLAEGLKKGLGTVAKASVAAVSAVSTGIVALGKIGLDYNMQMETYTTNFETMLGSTEAAIAKVDELKKFAASTPLSMDDLAKGTQTLLAFGVASDESTDKLRMLGDIALGDADKMQRMATAFGKATAQGKLTGETVQQMIDAGFNPLITISDRTGESMEALQKRMSQGGVSVEELEQALIDVTSTGGQFAGGMEKASHTTAGLISTLQDNARALVGEVFMPISEGLLNNVLPTAIGSIEQLTTAFREGGLGSLVDTGGKIVGDLIAGIVTTLPDLVSKGVEMLQSIISGIIGHLPDIVNAAVDVVTTLITGVTDMFPDLTQAAVDIVTTLATGIGDNLGEIIAAAVKAVAGFAETLTTEENINKLIDGGLALIGGLVDGILNSIPVLVESLPKIIENIVTFFTDTENLKRIAESGLAIIDKLISGIAEALPNIKEAGNQIIDSIISGISEAWDGLVSWFSGMWDSLFGNRSVDVDVNASNAGSYATGLNYVPYDNFPAVLHRGEAVLTAAEANIWRKGGKTPALASGITINQYVQSVPQTPVDLASATAAYFEQARWIL